MASKKEPKAFERYPAWIVLTMNLAFLVNYAIGVFILAQLGVLWGFLFVIYVLLLELSVFEEGCQYCCYHGKLCASGKGKVVPLLMKKGDPKRFCERKVTLLSLLPNMLVLILPMVGGAIVLLSSFSWLILGLMIIPWLLWFFGNPILYGRLACPHCKQGRICCPANEFFSKKFGKK